MTERNPSQRPILREIYPPNFEMQGYRSPIGERYGSAELSKVWDKKYRLYKQRLVWVAVAKTQMEAGLVTQEEYDDLVTHMVDIDVETIDRRENDRNDPRYVGHDVIAHMSQYADVAPIGGRIIGKGMTSEDDLSNEEMMSIIESVPFIEKGLKGTLAACRQKIQQYKDLVCLGYTHLQAAEPITLGYRIANYAQDFLSDLRDIRRLKEELKGKGIKGAVGTSASFAHLLEGTGMSVEEHERRIMEELGMESVLVSGQTYPRKLTLKTVSTLALIGQSCYKVGNDIKILQSTPFGEAAEPRPRNERGSFAMPHKRNPRHSESTKALTRGLATRTVEAWLGAADVTLERGLEDSAGKRSYLPESFLIADEALIRTERTLRGLDVREHPIQRNFEQSAPFVALEIILSELSRRDLDRQELYIALSDQAKIAWDAVCAGKPNPLKQLVLTNKDLNQYIPQQEIEKLFGSVGGYIGDAPKRCDRMVERIDQELRK